MKAGLVVLSIICVPTVANLLMSVVAVALGSFVAASPHRAAKIWGSQRLANFAPEQRTSFGRWYRVFGLILCLAGVLLAVDSILFSHCHR
jgi:membrane protein YqaA with SNARE-associated domain